MVRSSCSDHTGHLLMLQEEATYIQEITTADGQTVQHLVTADNQVRGCGPQMGDCPVERAGSSGESRAPEGELKALGWWKQAQERDQIQLL